MIIQDAVITALRKNAQNVFSGYTVAASKGLYDHNWVEIRTGKGTVVIDPWPSGGNKVCDRSHTNRPWDRHQAALITQTVAEEEAAVQQELYMEKQQYELAHPGHGTGHPD